LGINLRTFLKNNQTANIHPNPSSDKPYRKKKKKKKLKNFKKKKYVEKKK